MQMRNLAFRGLRLPRLGAMMQSDALDPAALFAGGQEGLWLEVVQSGGFSPASLFAGGQQGLLFEPEG